MASNTPDTASDPSQFERCLFNQTWHDPAVFDMYRLGGWFDKDRSQIVVPEGEKSNIGVRVVRYASSSPRGMEMIEDKIVNAEDLSRVAKACNEGESGHNILTINPCTSFARLPISEKILRILFTKLSVFPAFLEVVHLFGEKSQQSNEDFPVFRHHITLDKERASVKAYELCYNWTYVAQRSSYSKTGGMIWTMRKMGMYAKHRPASKLTDWIVLQASDEFMHRLDQIFESDRQNVPHKGLRHDLDIHLVMMKTASQNWTPHLNDLEIKLQFMDDKAYLWRPTPEGISKEKGLELADTQRAQRFLVELLKVSHALDINCSNIGSMQRALKAMLTTRSDINGDDSQTAYTTEAQVQRYDWELNELLMQTTEHQNRTKILIRRTESLLILETTIIPYIFARRENGLMLRLSEKATQYAKSMKVITVVCMLYLPPSLVSSSFGMGFLFNKGANFDKCFGYFIAASGTLMIITWAVWKIWERLVSSRPASQACGDEESELGMGAGEKRAQNNELGSGRGGSA